MSPGVVRGRPSLTHGIASGDLEPQAQSGDGISHAAKLTVDDAQIDFTLGGIDGLGKTLGYATYSYSGQRMQSAEVTFDSGEGWHASGARIVMISGRMRTFMRAKGQSAAEECFTSP